MGGGLLVVDLDATVVTAHCDKRGAAGTYKHTLGFHPLAAWLDRRPAANLVRAFCRLDTLPLRC